MPNAAARQRGSRAAPLSTLPLRLLLAAALMLAPSSARAQTAQASSVAAAAPGSTSSVSSNAVANEPSASAVVVAVGIAPNGGERVVVDCKLAAAHASEQLAKYCEGVPLPRGSSSSSASSNNIVSGNSNSSSSNSDGDASNNNADDEEEARAWRAAPMCGKDAARGAKVVALDSAGRAWAREPDQPGGKLCAFRDDIAEDDRSAAANPETDAWASAPDCAGNEMTDYLARDREGKAWGWKDGESCAWRNVRALGSSGG